MSGKTNREEAHDGGVRRVRNTDTLSRVSIWFPDYGERRKMKDSGLRTITVTREEYNAVLGSFSGQMRRAVEKKVGVPVTVLSWKSGGEDKWPAKIVYEEEK